MTFDPRSFKFPPDRTAPLALRINGHDGESVTVRMHLETCEGLGSLLLAYSEHLPVR